MTPPTRRLTITACAAALAAAATGCAASAPTTTTAPPATVTTTSTAAPAAPSSTAATAKTANAASPSTSAATTARPSATATTSASAGAALCLPHAGLCFTLPSGAKATDKSKVDNGITVDSFEAADASGPVAGITWSNGGGIGGSCQPGTLPAATVVKAVKTAINGLATDSTHGPDLYVVQAVTPRADGTYLARTFLTNTTAATKTGETEACNLFLAQFTPLGEKPSILGATTNDTVGTASSKADALARFDSASHKTVFDLLASVRRA